VNVRAINWGFARYAFCVSTAAVLLGGCGTFRQIVIPQGLASVARVDGVRSWMLPEAKSEDLLYVANYSAAVTVYDYNTLKLVGTLSVSSPGGECSDEHGNVFITNVRSASITEYTHGGTSPIATLVDTNFYSGDCFVDPTTGDLCVSNLDGGANSGSLAVYKHARGAPRFYYDHAYFISYYYSCAYDADGNAFVDASVVSGPLKFDELAVGARRLRRFRLGRQQHGGGDLNWDGRYLTNGDGGNRIYRFSVGVNRRRVYQDGVTSLKSAPGGVAKSRIVPYQGAREIVGALQNDDAVQIWTYPGGRLLRTIDSGLNSPDGVAVSLASGTKRR
jgi:hypothetical protein